MSIKRNKHQYYKKDILRVLNKGGPDMGFILNRTTLLGALGALVFAVDQSFKNRIEAEPEGSLPRDMDGKRGSYVRFARYHNRGFALGRLKERPELVKSIGTAGCASLLLTYVTALIRRESLMRQTGLMLAISGAFSNLYDRLVRGYVVDYIIIKRKPLDRIVINIGDAAIFAGSLLMALSSLAKTGKK